METQGRTPAKGAKEAATGRSRLGVSRPPRSRAPADRAGRYTQPSPAGLPIDAVGGDGAAALPATALRPSRLPKKTQRANVRKDYGLTIEIGFVLALLVLLGLFHLSLQPSQEFEELTVEQEVVQMEEILQTKQKTTPPPPPRPPVPVEVPNDQVIEEVDLDLDAALDIGEPLADLPPPPPAPEEVAGEEEPDPEIFVVVEQMPELIGGIESIQARLEYPEIARMAGIQGRVFVQFVVDEQGRVIDPEVIRGIGGGCDEEAIRAAKLARFKPGRQRGKAVKVRYVLPIVFRLK